MHLDQPRPSNPVPPAPATGELAQPMLKGQSSGPQREQSPRWQETTIGDRKSHSHEARGTEAIPSSLCSSGSSPHPPSANMTTGKGKTRQATLVKERVNKMDKGIKISIIIFSEKRKTCKRKIKNVLEIKHTEGIYRTLSFQLCTD